MTTTRSQDDVSGRTWRRNTALFLVLSALVIGGLACARAEVPGPGGAGSGGVPPATVEPTELSATAEAAIAAMTRVPSTATPARPEPLASPTFPPTPTSALTAADGDVPYAYEAQHGDTLRALAVRFGVVPEEIVSPDGLLPTDGKMLDAGTILIIPRRLSSVGPAEKLLPDSEVVFSPHAADFDVSGFAASQGGYLNQYREYVMGAWRRGPGVLAQAALDNSVNPRLLLAMLEYEAGWVTQSQIPTGDALNYPLGFKDPLERGLYRQLTWLANEIGKGYYGWRQGILTELAFNDGSRLRLAPDLNAGTVALQHYFAQHHDASDWSREISPNGVMGVYWRFFGNPMSYQHPLMEPGLEQPSMILPFLPGHVWSFTGGPHGAWERNAAWAALDFAPGAMEPGCSTSEDWVVAVAPGVIVRSGLGLVVLDLDGDGNEQTGWNVLYLHVAGRGRVAAGTFVEQGDLLGHPSCEGGIATGTHVHLARKYNGEWMLADGPVFFTLSGWAARAGTKPYQGALVRGDEIVLACPCGSRETLITR